MRFNVRHAFIIAITSLFVTSAYAQQDFEILRQKIAHHRDDQVDSALFLAKRLLQKAREQENELWIARAQKEMADILNIKKDYHAADSLAHQSIRKFSRLNQKIDLAEAYYISGKILFNQKNEHEAIKRYYKSLEFITEKSSSLKYRVYSSIARILQNNRDTENALFYHKQSLKGSYQQGDWRNFIRTCINVCILYNGKSTTNIDSSAYYGRKAIETAQAHELPYLHAVAVNVATAPIIRQGNYQEGLQMARRSLSLARKYDMPDMSQYVQYVNLAFAYLGLNELDSAKKYEARAWKAHPKGVDNYRMSYRIAKKEGKTEQALKYLEAYLKKGDSLDEERYKQKFSSLQSRLEAQQKAKKVQSLEQQATITRLKIKNQRHIIIFSITALLMITAGSFLFVSWSKAKKQRAIASLHQKLLRSQMNPHFLFNAMNAVQEFMFKKDSQSAGRYLGTFSALMRQILNHSSSDFITIREELDMLNNYLTLQQLRFSNAFDYEMIIDEAIDTDYTAIPPMFAQPFVENALEHGLFRSDHPNKIIIELKAIHHNQIKIVIIDSGIGISEGQISAKHNSHAIRITRERLSHYSQLSKDKIDLVMENIKNSSGNIEGLCVQIPLPAKILINSHQLS